MFERTKDRRAGAHAPSFPARTHKNFRDLAGKPLFHYIIDTLLQCPEIDRIAVNTDSQPIQKDLGRNYPQVTVLVRPPELCADPFR
jgi:CMP-N-acetylneuraminic acid synthetase